MLRVACIGECMLELACGAGAGDTPRFGFGGDTLNTCIYLARELAAADARVDYVTALGDDPFSGDMVEAWAAEGVCTDHVLRLPGALPGIYLIRTDAAGERSFYYWRERSAARRLLDDGRDAELGQRLAGYDLVYLSGITLAILGDEARGRLLELLRGLRAGSTRVAFDSNYRPRLWAGADEARHAVEACARACAIVLPGHADESNLFGDAAPVDTARRWRAFGVPEVVVKDGERACTVATADDEFGVPARRVARVVDTTAAGDAFNGAYLGSRLRGLDPPGAAERAHAVAAWVVGHPGAVAPPMADDRAAGAPRGPDRRRVAPAAKRNVVPITDALRRLLPPSGCVLEVASGTGQHVAAFARVFPALQWRPSDRDPLALESIAAWVEEAGVSNVAPPALLDVSDEGWEVALGGRFDAIVTSNLLHVAPWTTTLGLLRGAGALLGPGALLLIYGPFSVGGRHTAPSNEAFDASLRRQDPAWGVRDVDDVAVAAGTAGLRLREQVQLPANNRMLVLEAT